MAKSPVENAGTGELVEQPHGGKLWRGPAANPVAGPGRPPSAIRRTLRQSFATRAAILEAIAENSDKDRDRLKALDLMAKYGLGEAKGYDEGLVEDLGAAVRGVLVREVSEDVAERLWEEIRGAWVGVIGSHLRG